MICRTTAKEKKPSYSRHICAPILNRRLLKNSRPPVLFAYQSVSSSVWRPEEDAAMRLIFYRTPSFELSKKALLPHRVSRAFTMHYTM